MGLVGIGGVVISRAEQRVEISAQNLANAATPGYKSRVQFSPLLNGDASAAADGQLVDFTSGALRSTGNPLDLAISGNGFFVVRSKDGVFYTRCGQFARDADGKLVTPDGLSVQSTSGDMTLEAGEAKVLADGTVLVNDEPAGRLAIMDCRDAAAMRPAGGGLFSGPQDKMQSASPQIRQGVLEASNVSTADEMISIMAGLRSAQSGQRLVQLYDDLMGRVIGALSQS